jgi:hypothetical protein
LHIPKLGAIAGLATSVRSSISTGGTAALSVCTVTVLAAFEYLHTVLAIDILTCCAHGIAAPPVGTVSVRVTGSHAGASGPASALPATVTDPIAGEKATVGDSGIDQPSLSGNCNVIWPPEGTRPAVENISVCVDATAGDAVENMYVSVPPSAPGVIAALSTSVFSSISTGGTAALSVCTVTALAA